MRRRALLMVEYDTPDAEDIPTAEEWEDIIDSRQVTKARVEVLEDEATP